MGTSKSMPTPKGGRWTDVKGEISSYLTGDGTVTPQQIVGSTITAAGGLSVRSQGSASGGVGEAGEGSGGVASGGASRSVTRAISGLGRFGAALATEGLAQALNSVGIEDLRGKPATEVIIRIADHFSEDARGLEQDLLRGAIQQAIYNVAELAGDPTYENLEASLQSFLTLEGIEGLVEVFLTQYVFDKVWLLIEEYVNNRTDSETKVADLEIAVEQACRSIVHDEVAQHKQEGHFNRMDWFGRDGQRVAETVVGELERRLQEAAQGGAQ